MYEPFGPRFYQWWAGLPSALRYAVAVTIMAVSALLWWFGLAEPWFWGPLAFVGLFMLLFAGGSE